MYRVSVLYGTPVDPEAFDDYYRNVHIPIAKKMEGLTGWKLTWVGEQVGELTPGIHLIADLYAEDSEAMERILSSPEGLAAADDVAQFATGGVTFLFGDEETVE